MWPLKLRKIWCSAQGGRFKKICYSERAERGRFKVVPRPRLVAFVSCDLTGQLLHNNEKVLH